MAKTKQLWWSDIDEGSVDVSDQQGLLYEEGLEAHKHQPNGKINEVTIHGDTIQAWHLQTLFETLPDITSLLFLYQDKIEDGVFSKLSQFSKLTSVMVGGGDQGLPATQLKMLLEATNLEEIHLGTIEQSEGILTPLVDRKEIKTLSLSAFEGPMSLLEDVVKMPSLEDFSLGFERNFTEEGWTLLSKLTGLTSLSLYFFGGDNNSSDDDDDDDDDDAEHSILAEGTDFSFLKEMSSLRSLELESFALSAQQIEQIVSHVPRLRMLYIEDCFLGPDALEACTGFTELTEMSLQQDESESAVDWSFLERFASLEDFAFSGEELPKPLLQTLLKLENLRKLSLVLEELDNKDRRLLKQGFGPEVSLDIEVVGEDD
ncbi:MAG: hypothetical protein H6727_20525 [Myxococcales bacterium]|nr:hypothetical protein [Myxococcales bacterium]